MRQFSVTGASVLSAVTAVGKVDTHTASMSDGAVCGRSQRLKSCRVRRRLQQAVQQSLALPLAQVKAKARFKMAGQQLAAPAGVGVAAGTGHVVQILHQLLLHQTSDQAGAPAARNIFSSILVISIKPDSFKE